MKKASKFKDVAKFGGTETLGNTKMNGFDHQIDSVETQSKTKLEDDTGHGEAAIIRCFIFGMNPTAFKQYNPTSQELFNYHHKGIEVALWKDGMKVMPEVNPRVSYDTKRMQYKIFVGAKPMKGYILNERPQTLSEIAHA